MVREFPVTVIVVGSRLVAGEPGEVAMGPTPVQGDEDEMRGRARLRDSVAVLSALAILFPLLGASGVAATGTVGVAAAATMPPAGSLTPSAIEEPADASLTCADAPTSPFVDRADVAAMHLAAVDCLWHLGVIRGRPGSDGRLRFLPIREVSRAQFAGMVTALLVAIDGTVDPWEPRRPRFEDVPAGHRFDVQIHTLASAGIVDGVTADRFGPDRPLRRDQVASLLVRTLRTSTADAVTATSGPHFADAVDNVHGDAVDAGFEYGVVDGTIRPCSESPGIFSVTETLTRQQAASVLTGLIEVVAEIERGEHELRSPTSDCPRPTWTPSLDAAVDFARSRSAEVSMAAIGTDGAMAAFGGDTRVSAASVLKVMFLVAYLRQPDVRDRPLTSADRDLLEPMIRRSANEPATSIANLLGPGPMVRLAEDAGMRDFSYTRPWGRSQTSARDQAAFMLDVDRHVPTRHRGYVLQLLTEVREDQRWGIGEVDTGVWHQHFKGGWGAGTGAVDHQVALLRHPDGTRVSVAVMTTDNLSHAQGKDTLRGVFERLLVDLPPR